MKERIVVHLLCNLKTEDRTQKTLIRSLETSQTTLVRNLAELIGEGLLTESRFGTNTVYSIGSIEQAAGRGYVQRIMREEFGDLVLELYQCNSHIVFRVQVSQIMDYRVPIERNQALVALKELSAFHVKAGQLIGEATKRISQPAAKLSSRGKGARSEPIRKGV
jgi:hypothetical protein